MVLEQDDDKSQLIKMMVEVQIERCQCHPQPMTPQEAAFPYSSVDAASLANVRDKVRR